MFEFKGKKKITAVSIVLGATMVASGAALAAAHGGGKPVVTNPSGMGVTTGYGECWGARGGMTGIGNCGGAMPAPKPAPAPAPAPKPAPPKDSDGDGVPDTRDECPGTPKGVAVTVFGCPKDSDGDGVTDDMDKCPGTRAGAEVNADGCEIIGDISINVRGDEFDFNSARLKPAMMTALDDVAARLKASRGQEYLEIVGHTDSIGPAAYNQALSERRAQAVADYLAGKGIAKGTMHVSGRGESEPVADNRTEKGRSANRRVDIATR